MKRRQFFRTLCLPILTKYFPSLKKFEATTHQPINPSACIIHYTAGFDEAKPYADYVGFAFVDKADEQQLLLHAEYVAKMFKVPLYKLGLPKMQVKFDPRRLPE